MLDTETFKKKIFLSWKADGLEMGKAVTKNFRDDESFVFAQK